MSGSWRENFGVVALVSPYSSWELLSTLIPGSSSGAKECDRNSVGNAYGACALTPRNGSAPSSASGSIWLKGSLRLSGRITVHRSFKEGSLSHTIRPLLWRCGSSPHATAAVTRPPLRPPLRGSRAPALQPEVAGSLPFDFFLKWCHFDHRDGCFNHTWPVRWPSLCGQTAFGPFHFLTLRRTEECGHMVLHVLLGLAL